MKGVLIMKITKILSVMLVAVVMISAGAGVTTVKAAPPKPSVVYKVTPIENYKDTEGRYIELTETGELLPFGGYQDYIRLEFDEKFEAHGLNVEKVDLAKLEVNKAKILTQGTYLVGEIKEGKYRITGTGTAIMLSGVGIDRNFDYFQNTQVNVYKGETKYITVKKGQFALYLVGEGIKATRVK